MSSSHHRREKAGKLLARLQSSKKSIDLYIIALSTGSDNYYAIRAGPKQPNRDWQTGSLTPNIALRPRLSSTGKWKYDSDSTHINNGFSKKSQRFPGIMDTFPIGTMSQKFDDSEQAYQLVKNAIRNIEVSDFDGCFDWVRDCVTALRPLVASPASMYNTITFKKAVEDKRAYALEKGTLVKQ